jgi:hypothetical protein
VSPEGKGLDMIGRKLQRQRCEDEVSRCTGASS